MSRPYNQRSQNRSQAGARPLPSRRELRVENRSERRIPVPEGDLPGVLVMSRTNSHIVAEAVNVSSRGLAVRVSMPLVAGGGVELILNPGHGKIPFHIVYCEPDADDPGQWICGLQLGVNRVENLIELFVKLGCIEEPEPAPSPKP